MDRTQKGRINTFILFVSCWLRWDINRLTWRCVCVCESWRHLFPSLTQLISVLSYGKLHVVMVCFSAISYGKILRWIVLLCSSITFDLACRQHKLCCANVLWIQEIMVDRNNGIHGLKDMIKLVLSLKWSLWSPLRVNKLSAAGNERKIS